VEEVKNVFRSAAAALQQNVAINKALVTRGIAPPWCMSRSKCQEYWESSANSDVNNPMSYAAKDTSIVNLMASFWHPEVHAGLSVLELGCNCGVNLNALSHLGYDRLAGVEINEAAVDLIPKAFPDLSTMVWTGSFEDVLPSLADGSSDVVFSMASLMHVHPSSHFVFHEIARVARKYIATVDDEDESCGYVFPRDYQRVFERLGFDQVRERKVPHINAYSNYWKYTMRLFRKAGVSEEYKADFWMYDY
jgi:SAM-dependent methyltransferase